MIELLVVIAIIGILSAVVLGSLNAARGKGDDAAVKDDLNGIRSQAEVVNNDNNNSYSTVCDNQNVVNALANAANDGSGATACNESDTAWAASAPLKAAGGFWCVDNTGTAKAEVANLGTGVYACP